jgi:hypothetical protein
MPYGGPQPYSPIRNRGVEGDLRSLGYKFQDIKSAGLASGKIVWSRSPGDVSNDVGYLAMRLHNTIRSQQDWGRGALEQLAMNLANRKWKNPTKSPSGFVARTENRGSSYGLRLAYGAVTQNTWKGKTFFYGFALEDSYNARTGPYGHNTEVIGVVAPEVGRRVMERIARMAH